MIEENLQKLGFSKNEVRIYLTLLRLEKAKAGEVIKEVSLQRSVVYNALEKLSLKNLVNKSVSKGITLYEIGDPDSFVHEAEERTFLARKVAETLKEKRQVKDREVIVYEGEDIIKRVADKNLNTKEGSTIYFLGPSKFGVQTNLERYWQNYHKKRAERGIHCKILYEQGTDPKIIANRNTLPLCEARYLPLNTEMPMSFIINDNIVGIIVPTENPPLAFLIKSTKSAEGLKKYFEYLWEQSKKNTVNYF